MGGHRPHKSYKHSLLENACVHRPAKFCIHLWGHLRALMTPNHHLGAAPISVLPTPQNGCRSS